MNSLVPLLSFGGSRFRKNITVDPTFNRNLCAGNPGGCKEFTNSIG